MFLFLVFLYLIFVFLAFLLFFHFHLRLNSTNGRRGLPKLKPFKFKAYFIGIGFTSENKAFISGIASNCIFLDVSWSPSK